jgi:type I restriction enzyme M protein
MTQDLEKTLWAAADKLRNNMDAAEYKHIGLEIRKVRSSFNDL